MAAWHRSWKADIGLRLIGLVLCCVAYAAIGYLFAHRDIARDPTIFGYGLAAIGLMSASAAGACTFLGNHLFDEIAISARWRTGDGRSASSSAAPSAPQEEAWPWGGIEIASSKATARGMR